jgi:carboxypeptidase PM20D1
MAHYDVVPVNVEDWDEDPFSGLVKDGELWGRGTLDTKGTLCCMLESAEYLMKQGFTPNDDIYFAFAGDEETLSISAPKIVAHLKEKGIRPRMVLDEGGVVVAGQFPGVDKSLALIGTAEKGGMNIKLTLRSKAGHSSAPPSKQSVVRMAELIKKLNNNQMKARFTGPVNDMFNTVGRHSSFLYRFIFANKNILGPLLKWMFKKQGGQMNAITRTTIAMTKLDGSKAFNVLPPTVTLGLNVRLLQGDTIDDVMNHIYGIVGDEVEIEVVEQREASVISNTNNEVFNILTNVIYDTFGDVVVSPFLMTGATDSRHYTEICDSVFRFMGMRLHSEELSLIHSHNERIRIETIEESMNFYINLIGKF